MKRGGFTLIEMLVATLLASVLMFAVLTMLAGVSRDRKSLHSMNTPQPMARVVELLQWDLTNARSVSQAEDDQSLDITGVCGIDAASLTPNGRMTRISYRIESKNLWRAQDYLDSPTHAGAWQELVGANVSAISVVQTPQHTRLRMSTSDGEVDQTLWMK